MIADCYLAMIGESFQCSAVHVLSQIFFSYFLCGFKRRYFSIPEKRAISENSSSISK